MHSESTLSPIKANWGAFLPAFTIVLNALTWYSLVHNVFLQIVENLPISEFEVLVTFALYFVGIAFSAFLGATYTHSRKNSFLLSWMFLGTIAMFVLLLVDVNLPISGFLVASLLGISIGMGLPSALGIFADHTRVENRGMFGGMTWAAVGISILVLALIMNTLGLFFNILILGIFRLAGLLSFVLLTRNAFSTQTQQTPSYGFVLSKRTLLFLVPWIMFCLVNWVEAPIVENLFGEFYVLAGFIEFAVAGIAALLGGIFSDWIGRKRIVIAGFVVLGINYALLSLLPQVNISWYVYILIDGVTWGMFAVVFFMVLWGDLAGSYEKDRFYLAGGLPYLLSGLLSILIKPFVGGIPASYTFSLASFFLFIAVLPLLYAQETVSERRIQQRQLKKYAEAAAKLKERLEES